MYLYTYLYLFQAIEQKDLEIAKKKEIYRVLKDKAQRIQQKVKFMSLYESYLEQVKEQNTDEY